MGTLSIVVLVCLPAACIVGVGTFAWLGYGRVKAGFNIGRSGFYIEADDLSVQPSGGALPGSRGGGQRADVDASVKLDEPSCRKASS